MKLTKEIVGEVHMEKRNVRTGIGVFFLLSMCNIGLFYFLIRLSVSSRKRLISLRKEREALSWEQSYREQYQNILHHHEMKLRRVSSGLKEDLDGLLHLMESGESRRAVELLQEKQMAVKEVGSFVNTRSMVANAAVNQCFSRAAGHHIRTAAMMPEDFAGIEDYDLGSLLTNMLDNAIEGCLQIPDRAERSLHLKVTSEGGAYIFQTENTAAGQVMARNPALSTTKKEKKNHGYGTGIIRDIARKYHGNAEFFDQQDSFCCRVVLFADMH